MKATGALEVTFHPGARVDDSHLSRRSIDRFQDLLDRMSKDVPTERAVEICDRDVVRNLEIHDVRGDQLDVLTAKPATVRFDVTAGHPIERLGDLDPDHA